MTMRAARGALIAPLLLAGVAFAGCQTGPVAPEAGDDVIVTPVVELHTDDLVSEAKYNAAYDEFSRCMTANGATLVDENLVGVVWQYGFPADAEETYTDCYAPFYEIDRQWQLANEYDSPTQVALRECLEAVGVEPADSVEGVWSQIERNGVDPVLCASSPQD